MNSAYLQYIKPHVGKRRETSYEREVKQAHTISIKGRSTSESEKPLIMMGSFKQDCLALFGSNILTLKEGDIDNALRFSMSFIVKSRMKK